MFVSKKCQYTLHAIFEMIKNFTQGTVSISEIEREQAIPPQFLEVILNYLKKAGFVVTEGAMMKVYRAILEIYNGTTFQDLLTQ